MKSMSDRIIGEVPDEDEPRTDWSAVNRLLRRQTLEDDNARLASRVKELEAINSGLVRDYNALLIESVRLRDAVDDLKDKLRVSAAGGETG